MKYRLLAPLILLFVYSTFSYADDQYSINDINRLVPKQTSKDWWHKQVSTMPDNRYMSSFQSLDHKGKLSWNEQEIAEGKIQIVEAMQLAQNWAINNTPFGSKD